MQLDYDIVIKNLDNFKWFELLLALKIESNVLFSKITLVFIVMFCLELGLQSAKLNKNLIIYLTKLKTISHPLEYSFAPMVGNPWSSWLFVCRLSIWPIYGMDCGTLILS